MELAAYLERQGHVFQQRVFDQFSVQVDLPVDSLDSPSCPDSSSKSKYKYVKMLLPTGLQKALLEMGVQMDLDQVNKLFISMDLDDNGGLDFEEFKRAAQQPATPLEQWIAMLPINGMLARSFPVCAGQPGDQALRSVSRLSIAEINATVDVFSAALRDVLLDARARLQQMFDKVDQKAANGSDGAVTKYKTFKMRTGTVSDYIKGISGRVGAYPSLLLSHSCPSSKCNSH